MKKEVREDVVEEKVTYRISGILDMVICLVLVIMSFYQGGFYKADVVFTNLVICTLGITSVIVKLFKNITNHGNIKKVKLITVLDLFIALMPLCYLMPIVFRTYASLEGSLSEFLTYMNFAIIYFIVRNTKHKNYYINTLIAIAVIVAVIGIDEITFRGLTKILGMFSISYLTDAVGRISSTIQYANVTALVILIGSQLLMYKILAINTLEKGIKKYEPVLLMLITFLNSAVLLTESRMVSLMMILSTIAVAIYIKVRKEKDNNEKGMIIKLISSIVVSILLAGYIESSLVMLKYNQCIKAYLVLILLTVIYMFGKTIVEYVFAMKYYVSKNVNLNSNLGKQFKKLNRELGKTRRIANTAETNKSKKYITASVTLLGTLLVIYLCISQGNNLNVNTSKDGENIAKSTIIKYEYFNAINSVKMDIQADKGSKYEVYVAEQYNNKMERKLITTTNANKVALFKKNEDERKVEYVFENTFHVAAKVKYIKLVLLVKEGNVKISNVKLNNNSIRLAWGILPDRMMFRLVDTFYHDNNNILRKEYYKDALKLVLKSPLIGIGGEGFLGRYQEVQTSPYISSEAHSAFLQILVESGALGLISFLSVIVTIFCVIIKLIKKAIKDETNENKDFIAIFTIMLTSFIIVSTFDITLSFQLMVVVFAVLIGLVTSKYKEQCEDKDKYIVDNKAILGNIKIAILTVILSGGLLAEVYSFNTYRASIITLKSADLLNTSSELDASYKKVAYLEMKFKYDKYNEKYTLELNKAYNEHIELLKTSYTTELDVKVKFDIESDVLKYTVKQKTLIDKIINYEYYNKYVLEQAARDYFENFLSYAKIYEKQFENEEVAYAFYLGYAMKLTERINEVGSVNANANVMVNNIYKEYIETLTTQNKYLKSKVISNIIVDMKTNFKKLKGDN